MQIRKIKPYQYVELVCKDLVAEGVGISYFDKVGIEDEFKPLTAFIRGVLPGERFIAKVVRVKSKYLEGVLADISELPDVWIGDSNKRNFKNINLALLEVSEDRIEPACKNFLKCGGCKLQMINYEQQLEYKMSWLNSHFHGAKLKVEDVKTLGSPRQHHYRNHVQIHINKFKERGFYAPGTYRTIPFPPERGCLLFNQGLMDENFPEELELVRCARVRINEIDNKVDISEYNSKEDKILFHDSVITYPEGSLTRVIFPTTAFFQVNTSFLPRWLEIIEQKLFLSIDISRVVEFFSGFGFIGKMLQYKRSFDCIGIDQVSKDQFDQVIWENNLYEKQGNYEYRCADLFNEDPLKPDLIKELKSFSADAYLFNPPRAGISKGLIDKLRMENLLPRLIIYSSCNSSTFARDANLFDSLGYKIEDVWLLDFFPQTSHFEVVASFRL
jgi:23S rRNA (uracil1939-C5)-methyltransferase